MTEPSAAATVRAATAEMADLERRLIVLRRQRAAALRVLADQGYTVRDIAEMTGMKFQRVGQVLARHRAVRSDHAVQGDLEAIG